MTIRDACRRKNPRFPLSPALQGTIEFGFPDRDGARCTMALLDLSRGGISFVLRHELPGLEVGESIDGARLSLGERVVNGDFLVMHLTPDATEGAVCGALFFPSEDADILTLRAVLATLEAEATVGIGCDRAK